MPGLDRDIAEVHLVGGTAGRHGVVIVIGCNVQFPAVGHRWCRNRERHLVVNKCCILGRLAFGLFICAEWFYLLSD